MEIKFQDCCVITPVAEDSPLFDLRFYKTVKKRDSGEMVQELGNPLYGLTLYSAIKRIAHFKTGKKFQEAVVELKDYVRELRLEEKLIREYLQEKLPEKFDTGE